MKKLSVFTVYLDDGMSTFKEIIPADSKKDAAAYVSGNGEIIAIREDKEISVDVNRLANDLQKAGWNQAEIDLITRTIIRTGLSS